MYFGNMCHSVLPPLARPALGRTQASPDLKPLLPFHLLLGFSDVGHVHKALMRPSFGLTSPLKRKSNSCGVCRQRFNSEAQASSRFSSSKHAKSLKALDGPDCQILPCEPATRETPSQILPSPCSQPPSHNSTSAEPSAPKPTSEVVKPSSSPTETLKTPAETSLSPCLRTSEKVSQRDSEVEMRPEEETEEEKARRLLYCALCKVAVNSASQLQAHNSGTKHKTMLEARSGEGAIKSFPRAGVKTKFTAPSESSTGLQNKTFHCEICDVHINSDTQLKQHISSRRHKDRAAGKPAKPKFTPYAPAQRHQSFQAIRVALRNKQDLPKPLATCLLQHQLSVAASATIATLPTFPLRAPSNSSPALFQSQPLPPALLRPAPGPMCSTHTPVLFSPY
ncbi:zinc finger protein 385D-like [Thalassophryne amazonica]|uniref:zinc finger protein 385D-like n=1 Tax=Thalassophryne amazonica TaxID=390379 RepID=UPI00147232FF|nr:zinc finger protein 385D-like [Thalassophryne amazonica]